MLSEQNYPASLKRTRLRSAFGGNLFAAGSWFLRWSLPGSWWSGHMICYHTAFMMNLRWN